jgi:hypothetical protein
MLTLLIAASQTVTVVPGQAYKVTAWTLKGSSAGCQYNVFYNNRLVGATAQVQETWTQMSHTIPADLTKASTSGTLVIRIICGSATNVEKRAWFDDITMIAI